MDRSNKHNVCFLNKDAGTLKTAELQQVSASIKSAFQRAGKSIEVHTIAGKSLEQELKTAAANPEIDAIVAAGGDGTISLAAGYCVEHEKILGALPGGTMNLICKSLGTSVDLMQAIKHIANASPQKIDYATVNDRVFLHQFSVGLQPELVRKRNQQNYYSRIGKILSGVRATLNVLSSPPSFEVAIKFDKHESRQRVGMVAASANPHGEGHLPYPDRMDHGMLGLYYSTAKTSSASAKLISDLILGNWASNPDLFHDAVEEVRLEFPSLHKSMKATIDGELVQLEKTNHIAVHPGGLRVLVEIPSPS